MGLNQFKRLSKFIKIRTGNKNKIIQCLRNDSRWNEQYRFIDTPKNFCKLYGITNSFKYENDKKNKNKLLLYLESKGIETRPILTNFLNQPSIKLFGLNKKQLKFKELNPIEDLGFLIGLHTKKITRTFRFN